MSEEHKRYLPELIGTAVLVLVGCGAAAIGAHATAQLWLFLVIPTMDGAAGGWLFRKSSIGERRPAGATGRETNRIADRCSRGGGRAGLP